MQYKYLELSGGLNWRSPDITSFMAPMLKG